MSTVRFTFPLRRLLVVAALVALTGCQTAPKAGVTHVVVLWLKDHGNAAHREKVIEASKAFGKIPGVLSVHAGPCIPSARPIVDSSFDVALTMEFATRDDMQRYLDDPRHREATATVLKPLVKKITVYDFDLR